MIRIQNIKSSKFKFRQLIDENLVTMRRWKLAHKDFNFARLCPVENYTFEILNFWIHWILNWFRIIYIVMLLLTIGILISI